MEEDEVHPAAAVLRVDAVRAGDDVQVDGHDWVRAHRQHVRYGQRRQNEVGRALHVLTRQHDDVEHVGHNTEHAHENGEVAMDSLVGLAEQLDGGLLGRGGSGGGLRHRHVHHYRDRGVLDVVVGSEHVCEVGHGEFGTSAEGSFSAKSTRSRLFQSRSDGTVNTSVSYTFVSRVSGLISAKARSAAASLVCVQYRSSCLHAHACRHERQSLFERRTVWPAGDHSCLPQYSSFLKRRTCLRAVDVIRSMTATPPQDVTQLLDFSSKKCCVI